jgi:hypothetical protein
MDHTLTHDDERMVALRTSMRDYNHSPEYSVDERRVARYLVNLCGIGGGCDPIGFLIASHRELSRLNAERREELT